MGRITEHKKRTYKNGTTAEWIYLRTWNPNKTKKDIWVREDIILKEIEGIFQKLTIKQEWLAKIISYIQQTSGVEKEFHVEQVGELNKEIISIKNKLDKLTDLLLDNKIAQSDYDLKRESFITRRHEIVNQLEKHIDADDNFTDTLIDLINLASRAYNTFIGSSNEKKRQLINLVFLNLKLNGEKLEYTLRPPFDGFIQCTEIEEWCT